MDVVLLAVKDSRFNYPSFFQKIVDINEVEVESEKLIEHIRSSYVWGWNATEEDIKVIPLEDFKKGVFSQTLVCK